MGRASEQHGGPRAVAAGTGHHEVQLAALGGEKPGRGALEEATVRRPQVRRLGERLVERAAKLCPQERVDGGAAGSARGDRPEGRRLEHGDHAELRA
jgi:hypothetical protein